MNTIVQDLNDLTKIEVGNLRLDFLTVPMKEVIDEVTNSFSQQIHDKQQTLVSLIPENLPDVWADRTRLSQILTNLVSNAVKYTPTMGNITIGGELNDIPSEELTNLKIVHVWIQDTGIGVAEEDHHKIFQQYFRTDASKEMASGTGLGLSITKSLVEMQGGRIWFDSNPGNGTTFHFTIPVAEVV
jgi:signal transduction histidine kinase